MDYKSIGWNCGVIWSWWLLITLMIYNRHITLENSNIIVKYTNERIIPASGLAVVGTLLSKSNFTPKIKIRFR